MKIYGNIIVILSTCSMCIGALTIKWVTKHATITGYDSDKIYTFQAKVWNCSASQYEQVQDCDLNYPQQREDLTYTGEKHGVSTDKLLGYDEIKVRRGGESEDNRSSGTRTFKLQLEQSHSWVLDTLTWTQRVGYGNPPPEG